VPGTCEFFDPSTHHGIADRRMHNGQILYSFHDFPHGVPVFIKRSQGPLKIDGEADGLFLADPPGESFKLGFAMSKRPTDRPLLKL